MMLVPQFGANARGCNKFVACLSGILISKSFLQLTIKFSLLPSLVITKLWNGRSSECKKHTFWSCFDIINIFKITDSTESFKYFLRVQLNIWRVWMVTPALEEPLLLVWKTPFKNAKLILVRPKQYQRTPLNCLLSRHVAPLLWKIRSHHFVTNHQKSYWQRKFAKNWVLNKKTWPLFQMLNFHTENWTSSLHRWLELSTLNFYVQWNLTTLENMSTNHSVRQVILELCL